MKYRECECSKRSTSKSSWADFVSNGRADVPGFDELAERYEKDATINAYNDTARFARNKAVPAKIATWNNRFLFL